MNNLFLTNFSIIFLSFSSLIYLVPSVTLLLINVILHFSPECTVHLTHPPECTQSKWAISIGFWYKLMHVCIKSIYHRAISMHENIRDWGNWFKSPQDSKHMWYQEKCREQEFWAVYKKFYFNCAFHGRFKKQSESILKTAAKIEKEWSILMYSRILLFSWQFLICLSI